MSADATARGEASSGALRPAWVWGLWIVVAIGLAYGLVFGGMRLATSDNISQDAAMANVLAQTLALGYDERQPPLYEWVLWSVQKATGPTLLSFLLIKYFLLSATFGFLYLAARRLFSDWRWQFIAAFSPLLLYQIGWNLHEGMTHTLMLTCAVAASLWVFMRLAERGAAGDYVLFGLIVGLGLLSKYGFAAFLIILLVSAFLQPALRRRFLTWRIFLALGVAAAVTAPFAYWLIAEHRDLVAVFDDAVAPMASEWLKARAIGLGLAFYAPLGFLFPLDVILLVFFPRIVREAWGALKLCVRPRDWSRSVPDWPLLLLHITIGGFLCLILGALLAGATHYLERYMHPLFLLTPLWLLVLVARTGNPERKVKVLAAVLLTVTMAAVPVRAMKLAKNLGAECGKCRMAAPYGELAEALRARGFNSGTIIASDRNDAGNLRRYFPKARIVCLQRPEYGPPVRSADFRERAAVVSRPKDARWLPKAAKPQLGMIGQSAGLVQKFSLLWTAVNASNPNVERKWLVTMTEPAK